MVIMMTLVPRPMSTICRVASVPLSWGMDRSMIAMSGSNSRTSSTAARPSSASPTTSTPPIFSRMLRSPSRTIAWSSARITRSVVGIRGRPPAATFAGLVGFGNSPLEGHRRDDGDARALARLRIDFQPPAHPQQPLTDVEQPEPVWPARRRRRRQSHPVVLHADPQPMLVPLDADPRRFGLGVLDDVGQQLADGLEQDDL